MVAEGSVDVTTLMVLLLIFHLLLDELLFIEGACTCLNGGNSTGVGLEDRGDLADERVFHRRQDDIDLVVLDLIVGTLD